MKDQFELATTVPHEEPCFQVGEQDYQKFGRIEARALISQLLRMFGEPPVGCGFKILSCPHDFGTYYDVALVYDDESDEAQEWMLKVEGGLPEKWDNEAIQELKENGYPVGEYHGSIR